MEIYNEEIRDLLGDDVKKKLELKEHNETGVYVNELTLHPIHNVSECEKLMEKGWKNRSVGATLMNTDSSRSHSIFTLYVERMKDKNEMDGECSSFFKRNMRKDKDKSASSIRRGKLNLVDLAGSERQAKTGKNILERSFQSDHFKGPLRSIKVPIKLVRHISGFSTTLF